MRNFIGELKTKGYTYKALSRQSGVSARKLSELARGVRTVSRADYLQAYNLNRKLAYREARHAGLAPEAAREVRPKIYDTARRTMERETTRIVKHKQETTRYQLRILGEFFNSRTNELKFSQGFSRAYLEYNEKEQLEEAIAEAQSRLGGSNWSLRRLIEKEIIEYQLKPDETDDNNDSGVTEV